MQGWRALCTVGVDVLRGCCGVGGALQGWKQALCTAEVDALHAGWEGTAGVEAMCTVKI